MQATTPEDNSLFFQRKRRDASGRTPTRNVLRSRQMLHQVSHRGSSAGRAESLKFIQGKWHLSPDKQVYSTSAFNAVYMYMYTAASMWTVMYMYMYMCMYACTCTYSS